MSLEVWPDCVIINGVRVARPSAIARSRWLAYWEDVARYTRGDAIVLPRWSHDE
jgi:hypothetical protein